MVEVIFPKAGMVGLQHVNSSPVPACVEVAVPSSERRIAVAGLCRNIGSEWHDGFCCLLLNGEPQIRLTCTPTRRQDFDATRAPQGVWSGVQVHQIFPTSFGELHGAPWTRAVCCHVLTPDELLSSPAPLFLSHPVGSLSRSAAEVQLSGRKEQGRARCPFEQAQFEVLSSAKCLALFKKPLARAERVLVSSAPLPGIVGVQPGVFVDNSIKCNSLSQRVRFASWDCDRLLSSGCQVLGTGSRAVACTR